MKNTESLLEMLLVVVGHLGLARIDDRVETTRQTTEINPSVFREKKRKNILAETHGKKQLVRRRWSVHAGDSKISINNHNNLPPSHDPITMISNDPPSPSI
jgi:hypothetical protein